MNNMLVMPNSKRVKHDSPDIMYLINNDESTSISVLLMALYLHGSAFDEGQRVYVLSAALVEPCTLHIEMKRRGHHQKVVLRLTQDFINSVTAALSGHTL